MKKAVVLLSGGLDSATTLFWAKAKGFDARCLVFDYGQRHCRELQAARRVARLARCPLTLIKISLPWQGSALLDKRLSLPSSAGVSAIKKRGIPSTYVPARNTIFLSFALSFAEAIGASDIFIGANALDYSGYPDCRPRYYQVFRRLSLLATKAGVEGRGIKIQTPLIHKLKRDIIRTGVKLGVPYAATWSCYRGGRTPCGVCDSCVLRAKGFREAGIKDPLLL